MCRLWPVCVHPWHELLEIGRAHNFFIALKPSRSSISISFRVSSRLLETRMNMLRSQATGDNNNHRAFGSWWLSRVLSFLFAFASTKTYSYNLLALFILHSLTNLSSSFPPFLHCGSTFLRRQNHLPSVCNRPSRS